MAKSLDSVTETVIRGILPWSFTPKLYAERPQFIDAIAAPTLVTFGAEDRLTSTRFAPAFRDAVRGCELVVFDGCAHAPISEDTATFNARTLEFLLRHR